MRPHTALLAISIGLAIGAGCKHSDKPPTASEWAGAVPRKPDPPSSQPAISARPHGVLVHSDALVVDEESIRVHDILEPIQPAIEKMASQMDNETYYSRAAKLIRQQIIESVAQHLIWRRAKRQVNADLEPQIKKTVEKMEKDRITREFHGRETLYDKYLVSHNLTRDQVRDRLRRSVLIDSYLRDQLLPRVPMPGKKELYKYYEANLAEFTQRERREMWLIDVPVAAFLDPKGAHSRREEAEAAKKAREHIEKAAASLKGGDGFAFVAKKFSFDPNKDNGGNWGFITAPTDPNEAPLQGHWAVPSRKLFAMKPAETSEIIEAARSFFIIRVGKIEPGRTMSFQDAQPEISTRLRQDRFIRIRADFLQRELEQSTLGSLDDFVDQVMRAVPAPHAS